MSRKKIKVDWPKVESMCQIQCTGEEMASVLGISYDTLERRCKEEFEIPFAEYIQQKAPAGKASLRRRQYKAAMDGNATMLVWLGKNLLGQTDKIETTEKAVRPINIEIVNPH